MYDELVKHLRFCGKCNDAMECDYCEYNNTAEYVDRACSDRLMLQAADAIEELIKREADMSHNMAALSLEVLRAEEKTPRWIPVTERLPSNSTKVLVFEFGRVEQAYTTTYTADGSLCWVVINGGSYHRISDADCPIKWWMPLPEPPKEENKCKSGNM